MSILELISAKGTYHLTEEAKEAARAWFAAHERGRGFGNGRLARNLFEAAVSRHANRLVDVESPTDEQLTTLEAIDVASVPTEDDREAAGAGPTITTTTTGTDSKNTPGSNPGETQENSPRNAPKHEV